MELVVLVQVDRSHGISTLGQHSAENGAEVLRTLDLHIQMGCRINGSVCSNRTCNNIVMVSTHPCQTEDRNPLQWTPWEQRQLECLFNNKVNIKVNPQVDPHKGPLKQKAFQRHDIKSLPDDLMDLSHCSFLLNSKFWLKSTVLMLRQERSGRTRSMPRLLSDVAALCDVEQQKCRLGSVNGVVSSTMKDFNNLTIACCFMHATPSLYHHDAESLICRLINMHWAWDPGAWINLCWIYFVESLSKM